MALVDEYPQEYKPLEVATRLIRPNTFNPRTELDRESTGELVHNISINGVQTPLRLRPIPPDEKGRVYEVVDGDRRLAAAVKLRIAKVPAFIEPMDEEDVREYGFIANVFRKELRPHEQGQALLELKNTKRYELMTQREMVMRLGLTPYKASKLIALAVKLPEEVQELIAPEAAGKHLPKGTLDSFTAYEIAKLEDKDRKIEVGEGIAQANLKGIKARTVVKEAKEHPKRPVEEIIGRIEQRQAAHTTPTLAMSSQAYQLIRAGKATTVVKRTSPPGIRADVKVIPLLRADELEVMDEFRRALGRFTDRDAHRAGYTDLEAFKAAWIDENGPWDPEEIVSIIQFKSDTVIE